MKFVRSENIENSGDVCGTVTLPKTNVIAKRHHRKPFISASLQLWVTFCCDEKVILRVSIYEFYHKCVYAFPYIEFFKKAKRHVIMSPHGEEVDYAR